MTPSGVLILPQRLNSSRRWFLGTLNSADDAQSSGPIPADRVPSQPNNHEKQRKISKKSFSQLRSQPSSAGLVKRPFTRPAVEGWLSGCKSGRIVVRGCLCLSMAVLINSTFSRVLLGLVRENQDCPWSWIARIAWFCTPACGWWVCGPGVSLPAGGSGKDPYPGGRATSF
jgi:hypothetical protein